MSLTDIAKLLGKPYFQAPNCLIYNMDCLEALKLLPDQFVDLTVTSGPYNIGKEYEKSLVLEEYLNWCEQWIAEVYRVTLDRGSFWLNFRLFVNLRSGKSNWDFLPALGQSAFLSDSRSCLELPRGSCGQQVLFTPQ